jgi:dihydroneopterin aldolase
MPDRIHLEALELSAHLGVPDDERAAPQRLTLHLTLEPLRHFRDLEDRIENTVDYFVVARAMQELAAQRPRRLLETLAEEIAQAVLERFPVRQVQVELRKYILSDAAFVAVNLRRERDSAGPRV